MSSAVLVTPVQTKVDPSDIPSDAWQEPVETATATKGRKKGKAKTATDSKKPKPKPPTTDERLDAIEDNIESMMSDISDIKRRLDEMSGGGMPPMDEDMPMDDMDDMGDMDDMDEMEDDMGNG